MRLVSLVPKYSNMEEVLLRFPHIGEEMFDSLDEKSLQKCKKVCKPWKRFIEDPNQKIRWIQIIKIHEKTTNMKKYIRCPGKWSKLGIQSLREFANKLCSEKISLIKEVMFLKKYAELNIKV